MDIGAFFNAIPEVWRIIGAVFGTIIFLLAAVALTFFAGTKASFYWHEFKKEFTSHRKEIRSKVDEETDPLVIGITALFKGRFTTKQISDLLTGAIDITELFDEADTPASNSLKSAIKSITD